MPENIDIDSKTLSHLANYRLGGRTVRSIADVCAPYVKVSLSLAGEPANTMLHRVDGLGGGLLERVDSVLPDSLFLERPKASQSVSVHAEPAALPRPSLYEVWIHGPLHRAAVSTREWYAPYYDTKGKALVRGSLDGVLGPLNQQLEDAVSKAYPRAKSVAKDGFSNEMLRTVRIIGNGLLGAVPENVVRSASHVIDVYGESYFNQDVPRIVAPVSAGLNAGRILSGELMNTVSGRNGTIRS